MTSLKGKQTTMDNQTFEKILSSAHRAVTQPNGVGHLPDETMYGFEAVVRERATEQARSLAKGEDPRPPASGGQTAIYYRWTTSSGEKRALWATAMRILPSGAIEFLQDYDGEQRFKVVGPGGWDNLVYNASAYVIL